ncbi:MAG: hypothetical protein GXZ07_07810 [Firmicutes bacterium]|nr:hypothetical protein [Bacillota bacterium]
MIDNDEHLDSLIKKAIEFEIADCPLPDADRIWRRIENTIELCDNLTKKKPVKRIWFKAASVFVALVLAVTVFGLTGKGEALPFGSVFQGLKKFIGEQSTLIQFDFGEETARREAKTPSPPPEEDPEEMMSYSTNLVDSSLEELAGIYPKMIYYPSYLPDNTLKKVQYIEIDGKWTILMDFLYNGCNILFTQDDIMGHGSAGVGYGADAEIDFHRLDGVEYMTAKLRYGLVNVKWSNKEKLFDLMCNLSVEEALAVAQSLEPYSP